MQLSVLTDKTWLVRPTLQPEQPTTLINYFQHHLIFLLRGIFDSGYKYTYDRFNKKFVYIPTNADVAGLMTRTAIVAYPWFSPAGQQRGVINNATKLAYNPSKAQRDRLYPKRINSSSSLHLVSAPCSSVTRLLLDMLLHSTESTFAACSSQLSKHLREQQKHNSLNSTMS